MNIYALVIRNAYIVSGVNNGSQGWPAERKSPALLLQTSAILLVLSRGKTRNRGNNKESRYIQIPLAVKFMLSAIFIRRLIKIQKQINKKYKALPHLLA